MNFELMPRPPDSRATSNPWPEWPKVFGVDYGHAEVQAVFGADPRTYAVMTTKFLKDDGAPEGSSWAGGWRVGDIE